MRRFTIGLVVVAASITLVSTAAGDHFATLDRAPDHGGWYNHQVGITAPSGFTCSPNSYNGPDSADPTFETVCTEDANPVNQVNDSFDFQYDATPPDITFKDASPAPNGAGWNNTNVTLTWDCSNGGPSGLDSQTVSDTVNSEGPNESGSAHCTDGAGNESTTDTHGGLKIDKTNPTASIDVSHPPDGDNGWYRTPVDLEVSGSDPGGSGIASCQADVQNYSTDTDSNGTTFSKTCTDVAGNESAAATRTIKYDATPPGVQVEPLSPPTPTNLGSVSFTLTSTEGGPDFECRLDPAPFDDAAPPFDGCASPKSYTGLTDGRYRFQAHAIDDAGNVGNTITTAAWTVDTSPGNLVPNVRALAGDSRVVLTWGYPRGISRVVISRSPGDIHRFFRKPKKRWIDRSADNWQRYRYVLRSIDKAGNLSKAVVVHVRPTDPLLSPRDGVRIRRKHPPLFRWVGVANAKRYNLQLWTRNGRRHGTKVISVFPRGTSYQLPRRWRYAGHKRSLVSGKTYDWYVWPWLGSRYGHLIGQSFFRVR
jgi:hypothetical protein